MVAIVAVVVKDDLDNVCIEFREQVEVSSMTARLAAIGCSISFTVVYDLPACWCVRGQFGEKSGLYILFYFGLLGSICRCICDL